MSPEAPTYSSPKVAERVGIIFEEIQQVTSRKPWVNSISVGEINSQIPTLIEFSIRLKRALFSSPQREEVLAQVEKKTLAEEDFYPALMRWNYALVRLFAGDTWMGEDTPDPKIVTMAKEGVEQRRSDCILATKSAGELFPKDMPYKMENMAIGAIHFETMTQAKGFPWGKEDNWYRMMLYFYQRGMFDVDFQTFEPGSRDRTRMTGLRAHFKMPDGSVGCWAEWEREVRAFHQPYKNNWEDALCGNNKFSYALNFWDKLRLSLHGGDFNRQIIDRTAITNPSYY